VICEFAGTAVVQVMVAVVVVVVVVIALIHVCAKADGATRKTNRRGTDTKRTRTNLYMAHYRNDPQPEERGGSASSVSLNFE
jgi:Tfp pilus assembly protein PilV